MTVLDALTQTDRLIPNQFGAADKRRWLADAEGLVWREIIDAHSEPPAGGCPDVSDDSAVLTAPAPYSRLYPLYLEMQIHYHNAEIGKYNNAAAAFNAAWADFARHWTRTHLPLQQVRRLKLT